MNSVQALHHTVHALDQWILIMLIVAAFCTTSFPVLYLFSPWYKSMIGRALMAQNAAFALVIDLTLLFKFWLPPFPWARTMTALSLTTVALTTGGLTGILWVLNYKHKKETDEKGTIPQQQDV